MRNAGLEETQAGIEVAGRNINNLRYADDSTLMAESEEELKSLLMKVKEASEKVDLKLSTPVFLPENPRDRGAWWATVCGVAQSRTRLKRLSSSSRVHHEKRWTG